MLGLAAFHQQSCSLTRYLPAVRKHILYVSASAKPLPILERNRVIVSAVTVKAEEIWSWL